MFHFTESSPSVGKFWLEVFVELSQLKAIIHHRHNANSKAPAMTQRSHQARNSCKIYLITKHINSWSVNNCDWILRNNIAHTYGGKELGPFHRFLTHAATGPPRKRGQLQTGYDGVMSTSTATWSCYSKLRTDKLKSFYEQASISKLWIPLMTGEKQWIIKQQNENQCDRNVGGHGADMELTWS